MEWTKEFDEEFFIENGKAMTSGLKTADNIKQFISAQIAKAKQSERDKWMSTIGEARINSERTDDLISPTIFNKLI